jgi:hypothetical protein
MSTPAPRPVLKPLAILVSFLLALAGFALPALPAAAAAGDVSGATLTWGVRDSFRSYLTGPIAHGHWTASGVSDATPFGWSGGTGSAPGGAGTVAYPGSIQFQGHQGFGVDPAEYALDLTFSEVRVRITGATTAELVLDARSRGLADPTTFAELDDVVFATLDLAGGTDASTSGIVSWSGVPATLTAQGAVAFGGFYAEGAALAPVTFSWPVEAAAPTTVTPVLTASPTGTAVAGTSVTLTATATPAVSGTVQFFDGATALGAPASMTAGVATLTTTALSTGSHSLTAALTTPDAGYVGATSAPLAFEITSAGVPVDPGVTPGNVLGGTTTWGISTYLNAGSPGRANPSPGDYVAPSTYDAITKLSTWGAAVGSVDEDGSAVLGFSGTSVNYASTGNAWLKLADLRVDLDAAGNGTVSALVSYRTGGDLAAAPTRGPERVDIVALAGNTSGATLTPGSAAWSGLVGTWDADFLSFVAGDSGAGIAAFTYASTVTNDASLNAGARLPSTFAFAVTLEEPSVYVPTEYDLGSATWGISTYLNAGSPGRANPSPTDYVAPATYDATTKLSTWGGGGGTIEVDGSAELSFSGASMNFASTGNAWLRFADLTAQLDADGNGTVSALVSYRTGGNTAADPTRGPTRLDIVTLVGNDVAAVQDADSVTWAGLAGTWDADLLAFLAGDSGNGIAAWTYASTVSNDTSLNAGARLPAAFSFELGQAPDPVATGVALTASPSETAVAGTTVALAAVVTPAVAGTVTFTDGATTLGAVVLADGGGTAEWSLTATTGAHSYRASFVPVDGAAYLGSQSAVVAQTVSAAVLPAPGSLTWGVKASFRSYVLGDIAHGTITSAGGASPVSGGYSFPQSSSDVSSSGLGAVAYRGNVTFTGHAGALNLRVADPIVRLTSSTSAVLSVSTAGGRVDLATVDLARAIRSFGTGGAVTYVGAPATLTAAGAASFAGFYGAGEALDPVSFTIGSDNPVNGAGSTSSNPAPTTRTPAATPPTTEGITASQDEVFVEGREYTFTAAGFQPNETDILIVVYSTPTVLSTEATADADGVVTWTGVLPAGLTGEHTLTFQGSVDRGIVLDIATAEIVGCTVEGTELNWGFKESFRAYIDGSIANGAWTTADGATYETPLFTWAAGTGGYDAETGDADLAFTGAVRFTGHGGVLDTTIANPRVVIVGDRAVLLLDVSGTTQEGTPVSSTGVEFAELDLAGAEQTGGGDLVAFTGIPAVLTEAGAAAFGTYEAGSELDPVDLLITVDPACVQPVGAIDEAAAAPAVESASETSPILWIVLAIILVLAIAVATAILVRRTRRTA